MSQMDAIIRPYVHSDDDNKLVRFMIGKEAMEPLALANRKACTHPLVLSFWVALSCIFIQILDWWPDSRVGFGGYLRPLPAFAAVSLPIMFFIDWKQRPQFEKHSTDALKRPDITKIQDYYTRFSGSGLWIYDFGSQFVGLIAVDTSPDASTHDVISSSSQAAQDLSEEKPRSSARTKGKAKQTETSNTAVIRHFYVADQYRAANAQDDLIKFATKRVFDGVSTVERIRITPSPLFDYVGQSLKNAGFEVIERGEKVGIFGWTTLGYELTRDKWERFRDDNPR